MVTRLSNGKISHRAQHGTTSAYSMGCRCRSCTTAASEDSKIKCRKSGSARRRSRKVNGCEDWTEEQCIQLLNQQKGKCAICKTNLEYPAKGTHIDHNHLTGKVRGILCNFCNVGLGLFKDNPELLEKAANYLEENHHG